MQVLKKEGREDRGWIRKGSEVQRDKGSKVLRRDAQQCVFFVAADLLRLFAIAWLKDGTDFA